MELTTTQMALVFAGCVLAIGGVFVAWRRGLFGPKATATEPTPAHTGEAAK